MFMDIENTVKKFSALRPRFSNPLKTCKQYLLDIISVGVAANEDTTTANMATVPDNEHLKQGLHYLHTSLSVELTAIQSSTHLKILPSQPCQSYQQKNSCNEDMHTNPGLYWWIDGIRLENHQNLGYAVCHQLQRII